MTAWADAGKSPPPVDMMRMKKDLEKKIDEAQKAVDDAYTIVGKIWDALATFELD